MGRRNEFQTRRVTGGFARFWRSGGLGLGDQAGDVVVARLPHDEAPLADFDALDLPGIEQFVGHRPADLKRAGGLGNCQKKFVAGNVLHLGPLDGAEPYR